jgi:NAD(P)-dependent dehydrogenase (short-subunit alcohol dehydrogenase family)
MRTDTSPGDYDVTKTVHNDTYSAINPAKQDLSGKSVFVGGGSRGIGKAIVLAFARAGPSQLAVGARSDVAHLEAEVQKAAKEAGKQPPHFLPVQVDFAEPKSVEAAAGKVSDAFGGKLDILINSAGMMSQWAKIADSDPEDWWKTLAVNLRGPYLSCRSFIPLLLKGELKTICTVSSVGAHIVMPTLSPYQTSKLAVLRLTEFVQEEYKEDGIICFTVHPGNVPTEMTLVGHGQSEPPPQLAHIFSETPEISADTMVYLTSTRREWLQGRYINVTWDMVELEEKKDIIVKEDLLKVALKLGSLVA